MTAHCIPEAKMSLFSSIPRVAALVTGCVFASAGAQGALVAYQVEQGRIVAPLTREPGDVMRGRATVAGRDANCLLCHAVPDSGDRAMGNLAPPLSGIGARLDAGKLRLRIVDSSRLNRGTIMPAYYRVTGLNQVGAAYRLQPILSAQQVEDVVAYLLTLR